MRLFETYGITPKYESVVGVNLGGDWELSCIDCIAACVTYRKEVVMTLGVYMAPGFSTHWLDMTSFAFILTAMERLT